MSVPAAPRFAGPRFAGYAALFDIPDGARDVIRRGAFARCLAERRDRELGPLPLYWQHRPQQRIGTVELAAEDERGLRVIAALDNPLSRPATLLRSRAVSGLSFGYFARRAHTFPAGRLLEDIDMFEVSLVTHPLQPGARVHLVR